MGKSLILGLDVGRKRVGVATAEVETGCVFVRGIFLRAKYEAEKSILNLVAELSPLAVIVGCPQTEAGEDTTQSLDCKNFGRRLERRGQVKVIYFDEYFTSQEADMLQRSLRHQGSGRRKSEPNDGVAAALLLESYLRQNPKPS